MNTTSNWGVELKRQCEIRNLPFSEVKYLVESILQEEIDKSYREGRENLRKEVREEIRNTIGINLNSKSDEVTMVKMFNNGGLTKYVDKKEYINKVGVLSLPSLNPKK